MKNLSKKLISVAALAFCAATPAFAGTLFTLDFEKTWAYGTAVNGYYGGGTADDGSSGPNLGVNFTSTNVSVPTMMGLSNDSSFTYYNKATSAQGVAFAFTNSPGDGVFMDFAAGFSGSLTFEYSSPIDVLGAVKAYSGLDGTGTLLGTIDLFGNDSGAYDTWSLATLSFTGTARSFDFTGSANLVGFDNITAVPEPGSLALMFGALGLLGFSQQRKKKQVA